jgi:hypothetical protein
MDTQDLIDWVLEQEQKYEEELNKRKGGGKNERTKQRRLSDVA